jgi:DNA-binding GntR family transcriptional regulator
MIDTEANDGSTEAGWQQVAEAIRKAFLRGMYAPDQRLIETDLCVAYGASRTAVRSALIALAADGVVEIERNKGARVRAIDLTEALQLAEINTVMEGLIAAQAAARATPEQAADLKDIAVEMRQAVTGSSWDAYTDLSDELHQHIREISQSDVAEDLIERLRVRMVRYQNMVSFEPGGLERSLGQHEKIIEAIASGDAPAAEAAMREHLGDVYLSLRRLQGGRSPGETPRRRRRSRSSSAAGDANTQA